MQARITKVSHIEYAHRILNHPGKCKRLHGHSGKVELTLSGQVQEETGMVLDFEVLSTFFKAKVEKFFDHFTLLQEEDHIKKVLEMAGQKIFAFKQPPTAEVISYHILGLFINEIEERFPAGNFSCGVKFWETESSYVEVRS